MVRFSKRARKNSGKSCIRTTLRKSRSTKEMLRKKFVGAGIRRGNLKNVLIWKFARGNSHADGVVVKC